MASPFAGGAAGVAGDGAGAQPVRGGAGGRGIRGARDAGRKTEALCREVAAWGKPLLTLASEQNANVVALGARAVRPGEMAAWWADLAGR